MSKRIFSTGLDSYEGAYINNAEDGQHRRPEIKDKLFRIEDDLDAPLIEELNDDIEKQAMIYLEKHLAFLAFLDTHPKTSASESSS